MKIFVNKKYPVYYRRMVYNGGEISVRLREETFPFVDFRDADVGTGETGAVAAGLPRRKARTIPNSRRNQGNPRDIMTH